MPLLDRNILSQVLAVARLLTYEQIERLATLLVKGSLELGSGALTIQHTAALPSSATGSVVTLFRQWGMVGGTSESLAAALQAAYTAYTEVTAESPQVRLVWTGPVDTIVPARSTLSVLLELIESARTEVTVVGYALTEGASVVFASLGRAQQRGVRVVLIGNRLEQRLDLIRTYWPTNQHLPELYTRPVSPDDPQSSLHAKLAIVDQQRMVVTSANLTYHGLAGNVEVGVLVSGVVANEAYQLFQELIARRVLVSIVM